MNFPLPDSLPVPLDDGACKHLLEGFKIPEIILDSTKGTKVDISKLPGTTVIYCYPRTGVPGEALPEGWDVIPGARGCTPQTCSFRDHFKELQALGVSHLFGLSTQKTEYQKEVAGRLHLPFPILSDPEYKFTDALKLPTFQVKGVEERLIKRITFIIRDGEIRKTFYPIFPPNENVGDVIEVLWKMKNVGE